MYLRNALETLLSTELHFLKIRLLALMVALISYSFVVYQTA